ncbi:enoyl-CoA delta isomerase 1, mitochondrial-like [Cydia pomonella]|uniref:enoyl-CoA delta isomerase 1, mitochondrial-like n=1 Tax=Cydia pomonella TaxID=82600 RepID=UPI002ADD9424|nr:enoyl-CoA delta isomerase 1, mitochondrial-like [Cydia pomonella]
MFPLRQLARHATRILPACRPMSASAGPMVDVADDGGIAVVTLQRAPVNSLNLDLLQAMSKALDDVAKNKPRGMILTSASPTVFSAGLDIMEMYKPDLKRAEQFWTTLQEVWIKLFGFKFATAAAINGHAPAGGCLLAMSCEYRAMVGGKYTIGLNETALGIVAPLWFMDTMCHTIRTRDAELALTTAKLFTVDEALKVGMIDEVASDKADAIDKCKKFIKKFDRTPPLARTMTKLKIRQGPLSHMQKIRQADTQEFLAFLQNPQVQQALEMYIQSLKAKAK